MFQWFQHLAFVLWQSCQLESTNDLRSFNGSSTWLLYFGNPASSRVQMIYEASRGQALAVCTLAFSALLHGANTERIPVCTPANPHLYVCPQQKIASLHEKGLPLMATVPF